MVYNVLYIFLIIYNGLHNVHNVMNSEIIFYFDNIYHQNMLIIYLNFNKLSCHILFYNIKIMLIYFNI